jgi:hypothetical protein
MNDTTPEIERIQFAMMMCLGSRRRIELAREMYGAARKAILNSIPKEFPEEARRKAFVEEMCGSAFSERLFRDAEL